MVHPTSIAAGVVYVGAALGAVMLLFALRAYQRSDDGRLLFVASAFAVFTLKNAFVGYALVSGIPGHETLELIDAVADTATVLLFMLPVLMPTRSP